MTLRRIGFLIWVLVVTLPVIALGLRSTSGEIGPGETRREARAPATTETGSWETTS